MNKKELIVQVAKNTGFTQKVVTDVLDRAMEAIAMEVADGGRVRIRGFGSYEMSVRAQRNGYNPHTKQKMVVPESRTVKFRPSADFKSIL